MAYSASITEILGNVLSSSKSVSDWQSSDKVLPVGYLAVSFDENNSSSLKIGDGINTWNNLSSLSGGGGLDENGAKKIIENFLYLLPPANSIFPIGNDGRPYGDVYVPDNVTSLYRYVFDSNTNVQSIRLPPNLISVDGYAFNGTIGLRSIHIPVSLTTIGEYAFRNSAISNITFDSENGNISIGNYAFADCPNLTDDDVENIVNRISTSAAYLFSGCSGITDITVKFISSYMFYGCNNLKTVVVTNVQSSGSMGNRCFENCGSLEYATLLGEITTIGHGLFKNCSNLKYVYLSSTITLQVSSSLTASSLEQYIFAGCTSLEVVEVGKDWNLALRLNVSNNLTVDGMVALFENLNDRTGTTSLNIQLGSVNLAKLSTEQKAIATDKNWTLS